MSSVVALEATEPGAAHQGPPGVAGVLPFGDPLRDGRPHGRLPRGNRTRAADDPFLHSGVLRIHTVEEQADVVHEGDVQRHDIPAEAPRRGRKDENCSALG